MTPEALGICAAVAAAVTEGRVRLHASRWAEQRRERRRSDRDKT